MHVYSCFSSWVLEVTVVVFRLCSVPHKGVNGAVAHLRLWFWIIIIILSLLTILLSFIQFIGKHIFCWLNFRIPTHLFASFWRTNSLLCHMRCCFAAKSFCYIIKSICCKIFFDSMYHKTDSCLHRWVASRHIFIEPIAFTLHSSLFCVLVKLLHLDTRLISLHIT